MVDSPKASFRLPLEKMSSVEYLIKYKHYQSKSEFFNAATDMLLEHHKQKGDL